MCQKQRICGHNVHFLDFFLIFYSIFFSIFLSKKNPDFFLKIFLIFYSIFFLNISLKNSSKFSWFFIAPQAHLRMNAKCILLEKSMLRNIYIYIVAVALWSKILKNYPLGSRWKSQGEWNSIGTAHFSSQNVRQNCVGGSTGSTNHLTDKVLTA